MIGVVQIRLCVFDADNDYRVLDLFTTAIMKEERLERPVVGESNESRSVVAVFSGVICEHHGTTNGFT